MESHRHVMQLWYFSLFLSLNLSPSLSFSFMRAGDRTFLLSLKYVSPGDELLSVFWAL